MINMQEATKGKNKAYYNKENGTLIVPVFNYTADAEFCAIVDLIPENGNMKNITIGLLSKDNIKEIAEDCILLKDKDNGIELISQSAYTLITSVVLLCVELIKEERKVN